MDLIFDNISTYNWGEKLNEWQCLIIVLHKLKFLRPFEKNCPVHKTISIACKISVPFVKKTVSFVKRPVLFVKRRQRDNLKKKKNI